MFIIAASAVSVNAEQPKPGTFWEPGFPYLEAILDARTVPGLTLPDNLTVRGIILPLGSNTFACFDTDLLRLSLAWHGDGVQFASMAPISYVSLGKKNDVGQANLNRPLGDPISAVGFYPGVAGEQPFFKDPRPVGLDPGELGRGPIAALSVGRWEGIYTIGDQAVLHYTIAGTSVHEFLAASSNPSIAGYARNLKIAPHFRQLHIVLADYSTLPGKFNPDQPTDHLVFSSSATNGGYFEVRITDGARDTTLVLDPSGIVLLRAKPSTRERQIRVEISKVISSTAPVANSSPSSKRFFMPAFAKGGPPRWPETITTSGVLATNKMPPT